MWTALWLVFAGPEPSSAPPALDRAAVTKTIDAIVSEHIVGTGVPGVVVTVTEGDRVVLERGWGTADLETGQPMDPRTTLVRIASLSKTFTATAAAQLQDHDRLDLDADVDTYLQHVRTAVPGWAPVTVRHLLAHTSGFINFNSGRVSRDPVHPEQFEAFVARTMPPRMHPPGTATLYTNHGNALAGLVVQDIVGQSFTDYVRESILDPLGMNTTAYYVDAHQPELARSYQVDQDGQVSPWPYEYFATVPASAVHTTAHDMAAYLMLHAGDGTVRGTTVLSPAALARMRTPHATIDADLQQYHYAFAPTSVHGRAGRAHGGSVPAFLSRMVVFDRWEVGVFVAQNAFGPNVAKAVVDAVADALPPGPNALQIVADDDGRPTNPDRLVGDYRVLDKHETAAFTRPRAVLSQTPLSVDIDADGFLTIDGRRYLQTSPLHFSATNDSGSRLAAVFVLDDAGQAAWVHRNRTSAFRPPWHGGRQIQLGAFAVALGLIIAGVFGTRQRDLVQRRLWAVLGLTALLGAVGPQLFALAVDAGQPVYTHPLRLGIPGWLTIVTWAPSVAAVLSIALLSRRELRHRPGTAIAVGTMVLVALLQYWRTPAPGLPPA